MILLCKGCSDSYVMDNWRCPACIMRGIPRPRKSSEVQDLPKTPLLDALLARTDLHLAIAEALPLLRTGQVKAGVRVLEDVVHTQRLAGRQPPSVGRLTGQDQCVVLDPRDGARQCLLEDGHVKKNHRFR